MSLQIIGNELTRYIAGGPRVCEQGSELQCYQPSLPDILQVNVNSGGGGSITLTVINSPLALTQSGMSGSLIIHNNSSIATATGISSNFTGTALDGNVTETGNTCASVPPGGNCTLTYTPGAAMVAQTSFTIRGTNTDSAIGEISISSGATLTNVNPNSGATNGGTPVTLTGTGFTGATSVTFDGIAATGLVVVNSTTINAVTPAHAAGAVNVIVNTPAGSPVLAGGYTYVAAALGQPNGGGIVACLDGAPFFNLIARAVDQAALQWGNTGLITGASDDTDGATNTATIVATPGIGTSAAAICDSLQVDSQGNSPCVAGNVCYTDWFLPADTQLSCIYTHRATTGGFSNVLYWSSTESMGGGAANSAFTVDFSSGLSALTGKNQAQVFRCVRILS